MTEFVKPNINEYSDFHLALILLAGLLHDTGMFVSDEEKEEIISKIITEENNTFVSKQIIPKVYNQIRRVIAKYLKIEYQSNFLGEQNANKYFSVDESLINHIDGKQVWLLGIIDNAS